MPQLPTEIVAPILLLASEKLCDSSLDFVSRRAWFANTLLVGHAWYAAGQPLLYRHLVVSMEDEQKLARLLQTLGSPSRTTDGIVARMVRDVQMVNYDHFQPYRKRDILPIPKIPFITEKGRRESARKRRYNKLHRLLVLCPSLTELRLDIRDLMKLLPTFEIICTPNCKLRRLELYNVNELGYPPWKRYAQFKFWSHLSELRIDASRTRSRTPPIQRQYLHGFRGAFEGGLLGRLECLEICGEFNVKVLQNTIHAVQPTLRTLICNQPAHGSANSVSHMGLFMSVARTLTSLTITLGSRAVLADLSSMIALKHLTVVLSGPEASTNWSRPRRAIPAPVFPAHVFAPNLETIEWRALERVDSWVVANRVHDTLKAYDRDNLRRLRSITVSAALEQLREGRQWGIVAALLHGILQTRPGVQLRIDLLFDQKAFSRHRIGRELREIKRLNQQRMEDWLQEMQRQRRQGWRRVLNRGLQMCGRRTPTT